MPSVIAVPGEHRPLGGHVVDVSARSVRIVSAPNLMPAPAIGLEVVLVFARSDGNRELDLDGVRVPAVVMDVSESPGARVVRLRFDDAPPARFTNWFKKLARQGSVTHDDSLPEFDPEVWSGWAAISPGSVAPG